MTSSRCYRLMSDLQAFRECAMPLDNLDRGRGWEREREREARGESE